MINRFASARKFASKIVESKNLIPPIDPAQIIKSYGIEIIEEENQLGIEAFSELGEFPQITINTEFTFPARRKFTLAHELGHIIIPWHNGDIKCDTDKPYNIIRGQKLLDTQELEANIFASELLMPHNWIRQQITSSQGTFQSVLNTIRDRAQTSVMACLYALEEVLPSGNLYYVKKDNTDYWKKFSSQRTCTTELYGSLESRIELLEQIYEKKEHFNVSQYEIIYYKLLPCPEPTTIRQIYEASEDIVECINIISDYEPQKAVFFFKDLLNALDDVYCCLIYENDKFSRSVSHENSRLNKYCSEYANLIYTLDYNKLSYWVMVIKKYKFVFVKEEPLNVVCVKTVEPNALLRLIVKELYVDNYRTMLQRINGIVSNVNSRFKDGDERFFYNVIRYRFAGDSDMVEFFNHPDFNTYVINKIRAMLQTRKTKNAISSQ